MKTSVKIILTICFFALVGILVLLFRQIKINKIVCHDQYSLCNEDLSGELSLLLGKNIFQARKETRKILEDKDYVKNYSIYYYFPNELEINTLIRKPKYSIYNGENYLMIDTEGTVLNLSNSTALPVLSHKNRFLNVGEAIEKEELFSLDLVYDTQLLYKVDEAIYEESKLTVKLKNGYKVIFPVSGDRKTLLGSLIIIIDSLKDSDIMSKNDVNVQIIDLRFRNPVLK